MMSSLSMYLFTGLMGESSLLKSKDIKWVVAGLTYFNGLLLGLMGGPGLSKLLL
jgi:hypothetical protein